MTTVLYCRLKWVWHEVNRRVKCDTSYSGVITVRHLCKTCQRSGDERLLYTWETKHTHTHAPMHTCTHTHTHMWVRVRWINSWISCTCSNWISCTCSNWISFTCSNISPYQCPSWFKHTCIKYPSFIWSPWGVSVESMRSQCWVPCVPMIKT